MGYRISLYRCPKKDVDAIRDITDDDTDKIFDVLEKDLIKYDTLANVLGTGNEIEENLCSRIFNNKLDLECDMSFYTISREQLLNIIEHIRKHNIYEWLMTNTVDYDNKVIGDKETGWYRKWEKPTWDGAVRHTCLDAREEAEDWNRYWKDESGTTHYFNIDLSDNKWWISDGFTYKYAIFNFIHILKIFDWENDYLIAVGG